PDHHGREGFWRRQMGGMFKTLKLSGAWAKNTDPDLATFVAALESFDGVFSRESHGALYHMAFRKALRSASHKAAGEIEGAIEAGRPLSPAQQRSVEDAVLAAYTSLRRGLGTINLVFGDVTVSDEAPSPFPSAAPRSIRRRKKESSTRSVLGSRSPARLKPCGPWRFDRTPRTLPCSTHIAVSGCHSWSPSTRTGR